MKRKMSVKMEKNILRTDAARLWLSVDRRYPKYEGKQVSCAGG